MKVGIVGAGIAGLSAAYDLLNAGHEVVVFEGNGRCGGLAAGFKDDNWDWSLEHFYHHIFASDKAIIDLVDEIGMSDDLFFPRPTTSVIYDGKIVPFDSPIRWITFPGFNLIDVARFGLVSAYLRFTKPWRKLEQETADNWLSRWYGEKIYETTWRPLLIGKFGPHYRNVNMAWMWARLHVRTPKLGYFKGGFQAFVDRLAEVVQQIGGVIHLNCRVEKIEQGEDGLVFSMQRSGSTEEKSVFDKGLVTTSPGLMSKIAPDLPKNYLDGLLNLKSMGAVVLTLALQRPFMPDGNTYWLNIPADSPDKTQNEYPFLALVEHTNFIDRQYYGGDYLLYCGDYVTPDHPYMTMDQAELEALFTDVLTKINPEFEPGWIRKSWLHREVYAQPVPLLNHSRHIPDMQTPISKLYFASMSQVYPWDRGTNFAVEIGRKITKLMMND